MIQLQVLSKIIQSGNFNIVDDNMLNESYFPGYEEEFNFIQNHVKEYGNVPDKATFLGKFPEIELVEVTETDRYLVSALREENLYYRAVPIIQNSAKLFQADSNEAVEYLMNAIKTLQPNYDLGGTNIIADAKERYDQYVERKDHQEDWYFTSGFEELDDLIHGIQREEELFVIFARTNQGKSWVLEKMCTHVWELGFNVGYISPEMSASSVGYRFDTLFRNFSNKALMWGKEEVSDYEDYINSLAENEHKFIVSTPHDFNKKITVTKLKNWIMQYKLDAIFIDGITYLTDERFKRGDTKTTILTNISEDLMSLSMELHVPVLVVVQANRTGVVDKDAEGTPDLESIRDSDGISHNASKVLSIRQKDNVLEMGIKKQRFGAVGGKLLYAWDIDTGKFEHIPSYDDAERPEKTESKVVDIKSKFKDKEDLF